MAEEKSIRTTADLRAVFDGVGFRPSCLNMGWAWEIEEIHEPSGGLKGWLVNTTFQRPDTHTGILGTGRGRKEYVALGTTESGTVKTAWLLAELIIRHELMEAFLYKGVRIFDPHHTVEELSMPHRRREAAGGA